MTTITMTVWRRPEYTRRVLDSLTRALQFYEEKAGEPFAERMIVSADGTEDEPNITQTREMIWRWQCKRPPLAPPQMMMFSHPLRLDCDENTRFVINQAFDQGADYVLHLEDDTVLSPDALCLAHFYRKFQPVPWSPAPPFLFLGLHNHRKLEDRTPDKVIQVSDFHGWGWITCKDWWDDVLEPQWSMKKQDPKGWDWSISYLMNCQHLTGIVPVLNRVLNIGRMNGRYETPDHYDESGVVNLPWATETNAATHFHLDSIPAQRGEWRHGD
jgi:hypothetical protein